LQAWLFLPKSETAQTGNRRDQKSAAIFCNSNNRQPFTLFNLKLPRADKGAEDTFSPQTAKLQLQPDSPHYWMKPPFETLLQ
jgi:hypothetical protein